MFQRQFCSTSDIFCRCKAFSYKEVMLQKSRYDLTRQNDNDKLEQYLCQILLLTFEDSMCPCDYLSSTALVSYECAKLSCSSVIRSDFSIHFLIIEHCVVDTMRPCCVSPVIIAAHDDQRFRRIRSLEVCTNIIVRITKLCINCVMLPC